ncbi:MAG: hypothetical protein M1610_01480 [Nitrospirae bacterium]|nr:hypothetical protein [Nitrospirota bacterium]MDA8338470.1 hypothetical protein [Nitrospiraceae bacterium]
MRRKIILVLILLVLPVVVWGDEYVLVMSKEDNVCQHMLGLYNEDLRKYGKIQYDEHEAFTVIKWEEKKYYTTYPDGKKHYPMSLPDTVLISKFDINNDGKEELVVKDTVPVRGRPSESLYYLKNEDSVYFKDDEVDVKILYDKATGAVGTGAGGAFKANVYFLKKLPPFGIRDIEPFKGHLRYYSLGGWFILNPFVFKKAYYISMMDNDPSENKKFLVILKYSKDNQLKDICYYLKTLDCKNKGGN